jgi:hypothetical protein
MAQTVLGPTVGFIILFPPKQNEVSLSVPQEKRITLCQNSKTVDLALNLGLGVEIVFFDLKDGAGYGIAFVRIQRSKLLHPINSGLNLSQCCGRRDSMWQICQRSLVRRPRTESLCLHCLEYEAFHHAWKPQSQVNLYRKLLSLYIRLSLYNTVLQMFAEA